MYYGQAVRFDTHLIALVRPARIQHFDRVSSRFRQCLDEQEHSL
jgi:hypothetical protein